MTTTTFHAKQHVCVNGSTAVAEFVEILDNGYAKVEWLDKGGVNWRTEYPSNQLTPLGSRRDRRKSRRLQQEGEVPTNKKRMKLNKNDDKDDSGKEEEDDRTKGKREPDDETVTTELTADESVTSEETTASSGTKASNNEASASEPKKMIKSTANERQDISVGNDAKPAATSTKTDSKAPDLWQVIGLEKNQGVKEVAKLLPKGSKKCAEQVIHFFLFCYERQMVWERRNRDERNGDGYYTDSWAMQMFFFCNVSTLTVMCIVSLAVSNDCNICT